MKIWISLVAVIFFGLVLFPAVFAIYISWLVPTSAGSAFKISVATKVDQPVEGGSSVQTESIGLVHLGKPLLAAEFDSDMNGINFGKAGLSHFMDFSIESLGPQRALNLPPTLFLNREGVKGMEADVILERLKSEDLAPGKQVYLVVETDNKRVVFALKTTWLDHPDYVFIQKNFDDLKWDYNSRRGEFEVRQIKSKQDKDSAGFPGPPQLQTGDGSGEGIADEILYAGEKLFKITDTGWVSGMPSRVKIKNEGESTALTMEKLQSLHGEKVVLTWEPKASKQLQRGSSNRQPSAEGKANEEVISRVAASAIFWSSMPGLQFEMDSYSKINEIKNALLNLDTFSIRWRTIDYSTEGVRIRSRSF